MQKKILTIIIIIFLILLAAGLVTFYKNSGKIRTSLEPKYELGKEKVETKTYEKIIGDTILSFEITKDWNYEEIPQNLEDDFYKYALKLYKNTNDEYAVIYFYNQLFGVCGTGRTSKQITLNNGSKATIGYYDDNEIWEDISFYETSKNIAILNYGLNKEDAEEFIEIIKTINIKNVI